MKWGICAVGNTIFHTLPTVAQIVTARISPKIDSMKPAQLFAIFISIIAIFLFTGCAVAPRYVPRQPLKTRGNEFIFKEQVGVASYYGEEFNGRPTASGEIFDMNALTAAHRTLPLGTKVRVTNLENGRTVVVKINDRGPFVDGRILDLSKAAAKELGLLESGTAIVKIVMVK